MRCCRNSGRVCTRPQGGAHVPRAPPNRFTQPLFQGDSRGEGEPAPGAPRPAGAIRAEAKMHPPRPRGQGQVFGRTVSRPAMRDEWLVTPPAASTCERECRALAAFTYRRHTVHAAIAPMRKEGGDNEDEGATVTTTSAGPHGTGCDSCSGCEPDMSQIGSDGAGTTFSARQGAGSTSTRRNPSLVGPIRAEISTDLHCALAARLGISLRAAFGGVHTCRSWAETRDAKQI